MIKITLFILSSLVVIGKASCQATLLIKSAKIDFIFSNGYQKGTKTIIFKDSGNFYLEEGFIYTDTSLMFAKGPSGLPD